MLISFICVEKLQWKLNIDLSEQGGNFSPLVEPLLEKRLRLVE